MMPRVTLPAQIGRYRILGELGRGNMGTVYRGRDEALERDVAIKVMRIEDDEDARSRFLKEASAAARLQHPNIVTIYELGEHEGSPFMALELLEGMDLQEAIEAGIRPDPKVTLPIVLQVLAGLGHAHEAGIVHRDVKPSNIFLPRGRPAKIMDFGVARLADKQTTKNMLVGTPNYMSPEQAGAGSLDGGATCSPSASSSTSSSPERRRTAARRSSPSSSRSRTRPPTSASSRGERSGRGCARSSPARSRGSPTTAIPTRAACPPTCWRRSGSSEVPATG